MKKILFLILFVFCTTCRIDAAGINPPINITFRSSFNLFDRGCVLEIYNLSAKRIFCVVSTNWRRRTYSVSIPPYGKSEVGIVQIERNFRAGDSGSIKVQGYWRKLMFFMESDDTYSSKIK